MRTLVQDVRYALRMLRKNPGFTAVAVLTLALGIGATSTIFTFVNGALLRPLPGIADPGRMVTLGTSVGTGGFDNSSSPNLRALREQNTVFSDIAAEHRPLPLSIAAGSTADRVEGALVTPNYFGTLGVRVAQGRGFLATDDVNGNAPATAVISYGLWSRRFARDPGVIGKDLRVNGTSMTIVGVTEPGFIGASRASVVDVWVPMSAARAVLPSWIDVDETQRQSMWEWLALYGRLKPGVLLSQADAQLQTIAARMRNSDPDLAQASFHWVIAPGLGLSPDEHKNLTTIARILFGVAALLLLLACANVSNLLLARAAGRTHEMTVRLAVGAQRRRLVRQLLTESVMLALFGGAAGLGISYWAAAGLASFFAGSDRFALAVDLSPDWRVLTFAFAVSAVSGILFGIAPALRSARRDLVTDLRESVRVAPRRSRLRALLVVAQMALSLVLLAGAGLLLRTVWNFARVQPGFDTHDLKLMSIEPTLTRTYTDAQLRDFYARLLLRVQALPGVEGATLARLAPVNAHGWGVNAKFPAKPNDPNHGLQYNTVAPNYFAMMGIPLVRGRDFSPQDSATAPRVLVINETMARTIWPGEDPVGQQVVIADETVPRQVIGVVPDVKYRSLVEKPRPFIYLPTSQPYPLPDAPTVIHVRTRLPLASIAPAVQREISALGPTLPLFEVKTISEQIADSYWTQRVTGMLVAIFAMLALVLGMAGMYSVMAYVVAERTREVGIRMALGARATDVLRLMAGQGAGMLALGIAAGTAGSLAATRFLDTLLFGVPQRDPVTLAAAVGVLGAAGILASYIPARRATRVDPMVALRYE